MQYMKITTKGGRNQSLVVWNENDLPHYMKGKDFSVVEACSNQNGIRPMLAILCRLPFNRQRTIVNPNDLHDFSVTYNQHTKEYRLWVYTRNWESRAGWYAGMIHAYKVLHPSNDAKPKPPIETPLFLTRRTNEQREQP